MSYSKSLGVWIQGSALVLSLALGQGVSLGESMSATQLTQVLNQHLSAPQPQAEELATVVNSAVARLGADVDSGAVVKWRDWEKFLVKLGPHMSSQTQARFVEVLSKALTPEQLARMKVGEVHDLIKVQKAAGDKRAGGSLSLWTVNNSGWQSESSGAIVALARGLSGSESVAGRQRIVAHLDKIASGDAQGVCVWGLGNWREITRLLKSDISDQQKASWAASLRGAYSETSVLAELSLKDVESLIGVVEGLGQEPDGQLWAKWVDASGKWKELNPSTLRTLSVRIAKLKSPEAVKARDQVTDDVASRLGADIDSGVVKWRDWERFLVELSPHMTSQMQARFAEVLSKALTSEQLGRMKLEEVRELIKVQKAAGDKRAGGSLSLWTVHNGSWQSQSPVAIVAFARGLSGAENVAGRQRIVAYLDTRASGDAQGVRAWGLDNWREVTRLLKSEVSDQQKASWATSLYGAYTEPSVLAELSLKDVEGLIGLVGGLGQASDGQLWAKWVETSSTWKDSNPGMLRTLAVRVAHLDGPKPSAAGSALLSHIESRFLGASGVGGNSGGVDADFWVVIVVDSLGSGLDAAGRRRWAKALSSSYSAPAVLADLPYTQLQKIERVLNQLGGTGGVNLAVEYVLQSQKWRELSPGQLVDLSRRLGDPGGPGAQAGTDKAREQMMALIESRFLLSAAATREVRLGDWANLINQLDVDDQARQARWAQKISSAYGGDAEALAAMSSTDMGALVKVVALLDRKAAGAIAWGWVERAQSRQDVTLTTLLRMTGQALETDAELDESRTKLLEALETRWSQQALKEPLTQQEAMAVAGLLLVRGQGEKFKEWLSRTHDVAMAREQAQPADGINHLFLLFDYMMLAEMTGQGQEYPALGQMVARLAQQGKLDYYGARIWGKAIAGEQTRQMVAAQLVDGEGRPRLKVAELLTWAHKQNKTLDSWRGTLDQHIASTADGDVKALWMLAKGEAETLVPDEVEPRRKREWLDKALASATSEAIKLQVLREYVSYFSELKREQNGVSLLESVAEQFTPESRLKIRLWQAQLSQRQQSAQTKFDTKRLDTDRRRQAALLEQYQNSLHRAELDGDTAAQTRLQQAIRDLLDGQ